MSRNSEISRTTLKYIFPHRDPTAVNSNHSRTHAPKNTIHFSIIANHNIRYDEFDIGSYGSRTPDFQ
jgi:hypothetical protein